MKPINEAHVAEPGLVVVEVAACDDQTAFAVQEVLATRWATATADRTTRDPGEPGVRLRCFLDLRQDPGASAAGAGPDFLVPGRDAASRLVVLGSAGCAPCPRCSPATTSSASGATSCSRPLTPSRRRSDAVTLGVRPLQRIRARPGAGGPEAVHPAS
ncbi:DUF6207 family protein [Streptomyces flaveus]|uniref:DUF6207 family protein n=1 Tax=Streptomyces flaveus TaxID=66370 RepID=UPI003316546D